MVLCRLGAGSKWRLVITTSFLTVGLYSLSLVLGVVAGFPDQPEISFARRVVRRVRPEYERVDGRRIVERHAPHLR